MSRWWNEIDHVEKWEPGISSVSSPGHGGVRVARGYAEKNLSIAARNHATHIDVNYFWYEEDCDASIPIYELPHLWSVIFNKYYMKKDNVSLLIKSLEKWNVGYLNDLADEKGAEVIKALNERESKPKKSAVVPSPHLDNARRQLKNANEAIGKVDGTHRAVNELIVAIHEILKYLEEQEKKNNG